MKSLSVVALLLMVALVFSGCLYSHIKAPYDTNLDKTQLGSLTGEASSRSLLWLAAWGDAGTAAAAKQGGLTTINHMDIEFFQIFFGLYTVETTIVYGD
ncbi:MAG: TRL domain-containing protein [Planctomycetota bacterium]